jgi:hypothetical protein
MTFSFHYLHWTYGHADCLSALPGLISNLEYVSIDPGYFHGYHFQLQGAP